MDDGKKYDTGKPRWDLQNWDLQEDTAAVLALGAVKYGDNNWRKVANRRARYIAALMRHVKAAIVNPGATDLESGLPHWAHAACCLGFLDAIDREPELVGVEVENPAGEPLLGDALVDMAHGDKIVDADGTVWAKDGSTWRREADGIARSTLYLLEHRSPLRRPA